MATPPRSTTPAEPLALSAPIALAEAPRLCRRDPHTGEDCAWYHGLWQTLRILDVVSAADKHADFFHDTIGPLARDGRFPRVLVSGTADYSLPAQVLAIYERAGAALSLTVIDTCETPLFLTRWYAERAGAAVETRACDILELAAAPFDVICTHSFLGRIAPSRRPDLVAAWRRLLRPGGKAVTVNRVRAAAEETDAAIPFTPAQADGLLARALAAADAAPGSIPLDRAALADRVRRFTAANRIHPVHSAAGVRALFEGGGFDLDLLEAGDRDAQGGLSTGPSIFSASAYLRLVASRR